MRYRKLNRRIFKRNLKEVLKPEIYKNMDFEAFCEDYYNQATASDLWGQYELAFYETKSKHTEIIYTR